MLNQPYFPPLASGETWALGELGATEPLVPGFEVVTMPQWLVWSITSVTFASFSLLMPALVRRIDREHAFFWVLIGGNFLVISLLWLFYDRYALPLLPLFIALLVSAVEVCRLRVALVLLCVMALFSLIGLRDHLSYNWALWQAANAAGHLASISQINGGYIVNGWLQYAHPENAPRDKSGAVAIPWMNVADDGVSPYLIANRRLSGYHVIQSIPYRRWLGQSGSIYILQRDLPPN
jgi:hypothetical protein